jgi:ABC-type lipoprotein export system ATPase subunit
MIDIKHLTKSFQTPRGKITVLNDFSLTALNSTFLGIAGKSGAGKSTLLSLIAGLQKPDSGSIKIDTNEYENSPTEITSLSEKELSAFRNKNIGFVSQEQSFLENLTVLDNVRLPAYLSKSEKKKLVMLNLFQHLSNKHSNQFRNDSRPEVITERARSLLEDFGIAHLADQYPQNLSGGENHRVLIARALINNPQIILADEPTDSVDSERTEEIIHIFHSLANQGKIVILVSHDKEALKLGDKIITI